MLDVRRLRLLRELAHRGTIAAVAQAQAFSPSAVSQQLAVLEREAGVALLERSGRRVELTPAGRRLVEHAEAVLERLEAAASELAATREGVAGTVRIGAFPTVARGLLPAALRSLGAEHPALEVRLYEVDPAGVGDAVRGGELDAALVHSYEVVARQIEGGIGGSEGDGASWSPAQFPAPPNGASRRPGRGNEGLDLVPLLSEPVYLATPPWSAAPGLAARRDDPWIVASPGTLCHAMTVRACADAGFEPRIRHRVDEYATVLDLVAAGQGVALVPALGLIGAPSGALALERLPLHRRIGLLHRLGGAGHPAVAAVRDALRRAAAEREPAWARQG